MPSPRFLQLRAAALATTAALVLGTAACGGSDDGGSDDSAGDQQQARATVERLYAAFRAGDPAAICDQLSERFQRQLAQGALGSKSSSCAGSFQKFLDQAEEAGGLDLTLKAKVKSVKVTGDKAIAKVTFGGAGRNGDIPLEKIDGQWKLAALGPAPSQ